MRGRVVLALALGLVVVGGTAGCKRIAEALAEKAVEKGTGGKVKIDKGAVTLNVDGGSVTFGNAKIPEAWPKDVPVYPGLQLISSVVADDPVKHTKGWMLMGKTPDTPEQIMAFYKSKLTAFKQDTEVNLQGGRQLDFSQESSSEFVQVRALAGTTPTELWLTAGIAPKKTE